MGLFENPYPAAPRSEWNKLIHSLEAVELARTIDKESIVLLENHNETLPLKKSGSIAVIGPMAHGFMNVRLSPLQLLESSQLTHPVRRLRDLRQPMARRHPSRRHQSRRWRRRHGQLRARLRTLEQRRVRLRRSHRSSQEVRCGHRRGRHLVSRPNRTMGELQRHVRPPALSPLPQFTPH